MISKTKALILGAAFVLTAGVAQAALTVADVLPTYQDGSYSAVEVRETASQITVEATKNGVRTRTVFDKASSAILSSQDQSANGGGASAGGDSDSDRGGDDDHGGSDNGGGDHDGGGDHGGSDHDGGGDHDGGSDHDNS